VERSFAQRSNKLERIDTGDHTPEEYATFLREIAFINRYLGDRRAIRKTLLREISRESISDFSLLDVGAGSGELLATVADFAARSGRRARLVGLDLNPQAAAAIAEAAVTDNAVVRGNAFNLPFADGTFDYSISSLFFHHLTNDQIPRVLAEMSRVSRRGVFIIDLHRHPAAYYLYKLFCLAFRISPLVTQDGALSVLRSFRPGELESIAGRKDLRTWLVAPFRIVVKAVSGDES
jgi:ubiquinone/menaquinone biosynthesis C-methylase UbiE